jgi:hypothetical protein
MIRLPVPAVVSISAGMNFQYYYCLFWANFEIKIIYLDDF